MSASHKIGLNPLGDTASGFGPILPEQTPLSLAYPAKAGTDTWVPDADGDWATIANWSNGLPTSNTAVTINTTDTHSITHSTGNDFAKSLTVGNDQFALTGGTLTIAGATSFADGLTIAGGILSAGKVSIKGPGIFEGGSVTGNTALSISGAATLAGNFGLLGSATLTNTGTTSLTGNIFVGDATGVNATITNAKGGVFQIAGAYNINVNAQSAAMVNAGTLAMTAGSSASVVGLDTQSTGSITAVLGATLEFEGTNNVISGSIGGAGQIAFGGNGDTTLTDASITIGTLGLYNTATLILGTSTRLTGALIDESNGSNFLQLGANNLAVSGPTILAGSYGNDTIAGSGTLSLAGTTTIGGQVIFGGALTISNTGTVNQTGACTLGDGSGSPATFNNAAGAVYDIAADTNIGIGSNTASVINNAGLFEKSQSTNISQVAVQLANQAGATVNVGTGTLEFSNIVTNAGTLAGSGELAIDNSGNATLGAGTSLTVGTLALFNTAILNIGQSLSYAGVFVDDSNGNDALNLEANTLTLTGGGNIVAGNFGTAFVDGTGTLVVAGALALSQAVIGQTAEVSNTGTIFQAGNVTIGDGSGEVASIVNTAKGTYALVNAYTLNDGVAVSSHFDNAGLFSVTAGTGTATIATTFNNQSGGTISIVSGALDNQSILVNAGAINGTDLQLSGNSQTTLNSGTSLGVGEIDLYNAAALNLGANESFAGFFNDDSQSQGNGTVNLAAHSLTLSGPANFIGNYGQTIVTGSGTLFSKGASTMSVLQIGATATFSNAGSMTVTGGLQVGDSSGGAATFNNTAKGIYDLVNDSGLTTTTTSDFANAGLFEKTQGGGTSFISGHFTNTGTIEVSSTGTLEFTAGTLNNTGTIIGTVTTDQQGDIFITK
jgi:hypothetical protein